MGYGRRMPHTKLLADGNQMTVDESESQLAQLDLSAYRSIRLSVDNWVNSPAPVVIAVSHVDQPNTINANFITALDSFTVPPGGSVSRVYEVPGEVVAFLASPEHPPLPGIEIFFTVYGRAD
jgi:acetaldehyde dehydrogenase (acetylating)